MDKHEILVKGKDLFEVVEQGRLTDAILMLKEIGDPLASAAVVLCATYAAVSHETDVDPCMHKLGEAMLTVLKREEYVHTVNVLVLASRREEFNRYRDTMVKTFENLAVDIEEEEEDECCVIGSRFEGEMVIPVTFRSDNEDLVEKVSELVCAAFDWAWPMPHPPKTKKKSLCEEEEENCAMDCRDCDQEGCMDRDAEFSGKPKKRVKLPNKSMKKKVRRV